MPLCSTFSGSHCIPASVRMFYLTCCISTIILSFQKKICYLIHMTKLWKLSRPSSLNYSFSTVVPMTALYLEEKTCILMSVLFVIPSAMYMVLLLFHGSTTVPVKCYTYLPGGSRLVCLFGTPNLASIVQNHSPTSGEIRDIMYDIHHSPVWKTAYSKDGVFQGDQRGLAFSICADGVNPFSHNWVCYSMWPVVLTFSIFLAWFGNHLQIYFLLE